MNTAAQVNPHAARGENDRKILQRDTTPQLFRPITFRSVTAKNRIMVSPMCQYSATDGVADDWHFQHLASRAVGGAGIVFTEVAHTESRGRITPSLVPLGRAISETTLHFSLIRIRNARGWTIQ